MMNKIAMPQLFVLPRWFNVAGWVVFICVVGMTFSKTGRALFSAHPICMTLGCAGFMTEVRAVPVTMSLLPYVPTKRLAYGGGSGCT